jgi:hypothetical protein
MEKPMATVFARVGLVTFICAGSALAQSNVLPRDLRSRNLAQGFSDRPESVRGFRSDDILICLGEQPGSKAGEATAVDQAGVAHGRAVVRLWPSRRPDPRSDSAALEQTDELKGSDADAYYGYEDETSPPDAPAPETRVISMSLPTGFSPRPVPQTGHRSSFAMPRGAVFRPARHAISSCAPRRHAFVASSYSYR